MPQKRLLWTAERIERNDGVGALRGDVIGQRKLMAHEARFDRKRVEIPTSSLGERSLLFFDEF